MTWTASALIQQITKQANSSGLQIECAASGNVNATIAIVSEAPGENEARLRMPQVGGGGRHLWEVLHPYGITRNDVWVTNVIKRQILAVDDTKTPVPRGELQHWHRILDWELSQLPNLRYILVLGNAANEFFIGHREIMKWRGTKTSWRDKLLFITVNPALVIRDPKFDIIFHIDIKKFSHLLEGKWNDRPVQCHINPSPMESVRWIQRMAAENKPVSFDIETASDETACIGLGNSASEAMCINFRSQSGHTYTPYEERFIRREFARLFANPKVKFIAQNGCFDIGWLWWKDRIRVRRLWFDTLLAHHALYPPLPHNLAFLVSTYTYHPYYKDDKTTWRDVGDIDAYWNYNCKDVAYTWEIHESLNNELVAQGMDKFFFDHVMHLQPHLMEMMIHGVKIDVPFKEQVAKQLRLELEGGIGDDGVPIVGILQKFHAAVQRATNEPDYTPNPNSPKQLRELFFTKLRLVGRGSSTDEDNRFRMLAHYKTNNDSRDMIRILDDYKTDHKFVSTYAEMECDDDGRIRTEYKQYGTKSAPGRLSSSQTAWDTGGNLQNQPERAKSMFVADEGCRFVYFDLAQAEARVVGWLAVIQSWIDQFELARVDGKFDCHRALASQMYKVPYDDVPTKDWDADGKPTIRYKSKRCRHGLNYRMQADRLATEAKISFQEAVRSLEIYHQLTPELRRWWEYTTEVVRSDKVLYSCLGRRWILLERFDDDALESIIAFVPQSTIGDKVSQIIYQTNEDVRWDYGRVTNLLNNHDSLITQVPDNDKDATRALSILKHYAESPINVKGIDGQTRELIIPADVAWSQPDKKGIHRWSTLKKIPNFQPSIHW